MFVNGLSKKNFAKKVNIDPATVERVIDEGRVFEKTREKIVDYLE